MNSLFTCFAIVVVFSFAKAGYDKLTKCETALRTHFLYDCPEDEKFVRARCNITTGNFKPKQCYGQWCYCVSAQRGRILKNYKNPRSSSCAQNCRCAVDEENTRKDLNCEPNGNYPNGTSGKQCQWWDACYTGDPSKIPTKSNCLNMDGPITEFRRCAKDGTYMATSCTSVYLDKTCSCYSKLSGDRLVELKNTSVFNTLKCDCLQNRRQYIDNLPKVNGKIPFDANAKADKAFVCKNGNHEGPCIALKKIGNANYTKHMCDADGYFNALQCNTTTNNKCFCADKYTGKKIENYEYDYYNYRLPSNCKCARDAIILARNGKPKPACQPDGSYKSCSTVKEEWSKMGGADDHTAPQCNCVGRFKGKQCLKNTCHCVDIYGNYIGFVVPLAVTFRINMTCDCARDYYKFMLADKQVTRVPEFFCNNAGGYPDIPR